MFGVHVCWERPFESKTVAVPLFNPVSLPGKTLCGKALAEVLRKIWVPSPVSFPDENRRWQDFSEMDRTL